MGYFWYGSKSRQGKAVINNLKIETKNSIKC